MIAIERHDGRLMLVRYANPSDSTVVLLAEFLGEGAVAEFQAEVAMSMKFAREVGRSGIA